jgi:hypothetical protein
MEALDKTKFNSNIQFMYLHLISGLRGADSGKDRKAYLSSTTASRNGFPIFKNCGKTI